ncbi:MAG: DUF2071 domain-containing protein [Chitinophagales bacterium]|nr:DUF2071 domain-containing protein [Chitinophagales bacterium]
MTFLTASWRKLLMVNYEVDPAVLKPYIPFGTELDFWQGKCYVSLVGFMFMDTRILGVSVPFHRNFEEVNLRFYVRRLVDGEWRRGVVFIKEIVPKPAITIVANTVYGEHYATYRMRHTWDLQPKRHIISYEWKPFWGGTWYKLAAEASPIALTLEVGSEAEFITEHYWGYAQTGPQSTNEYQVQHPRWDIYPVEKLVVAGDFTRLYGPAFSASLAAAPGSCFLAEGSEVSVFQKARI